MNQANNHDNQRKINEIVHLSIDKFYHTEKQNLLSKHAFFYSQLKLLKKRWLFLQTILLFLLFIFIQYSPDMSYYSSSLGIVSCLLIIFLMPELWRDKNTDKSELVNTCFYSLEHLYAVKIIIFGIYDLMILTIFFIIATFTAKITFYMIVVHFLLPLVITACICFYFLTKNDSYNYLTTLCLCIFTSFMWYMLTSIEIVYTKVSIVIWVLLLMIAVLFLLHEIKKIIMPLGGFTCRF